MKQNALNECKGKGGKMRYGLPYKGSKNQIAEWVVNELPKAEVFVDLFFGGGAITHRAMLTGKYKRFIVNDIDGRLPDLFRECAYGKHTIKTHPEWISKAEFEEKKADNAYIALVWSFGNNGIDYLYGAEIEPFKKGLHYACFYRNMSLLEEQKIFLTDTTETDVYKRYLFFRQQLERLKKKPQYCENLTRAVEIERLQGLQGLQSLQSLQSLHLDYQQVNIPEGALIYCDPPYAGTICGKYRGFDSKRFYEWAEKQDNIYISEYDMPEAFVPIAQTEKVVLSAAAGNAQTAIEKLYTNKKTWDKFSSDKKDLCKLNFSEQLSFDDI